MTDETSALLSPPDEQPSPEEVWDLVMEPTSPWFDLRLGDLWRYRDLVLLFVRRDFVAQFKQTILGPAWFVLQPLLATLMFTVVFGNIAGMSSDGLPKVLFYLSGTILWQYFANCLTNTADTFRANAGIFGKVYFPRLVVPVSIVISQFLKLALQFAIFGVFLLYFLARGSTVHLTSAAGLLPVLVLIMAMFGLGSGIIISSLVTKYRDLFYLVQYTVQLLMYTTTVIYPLSAITSPKLRLLILANPMTGIIETFRAGFLGTGSISPLYLGYSAAAACLVMLVGTILFTRVERTFMDTV